MAMTNAIVQTTIPAMIIGTALSSREVMCEAY
jgi:hypothetical protein